MRLWWAETQDKAFELVYNDVVVSDFNLVAIEDFWSGYSKSRALQ